MNGTSPEPQSQLECLFCTGETKGHAIHGLEGIPLCVECRNKFIYLRYLADPNSGSVMGFKCSACGFECDVPGIMECVNDGEGGEMSFVTKVDRMHNFCQSCGVSSKPT